MLIKTYKCNICRDENEPDDLCGLVFSNTREFTLSYCRQTDGAHICRNCLSQIIEQGNWFEREPF